MSACRLLEQGSYSDVAFTVHGEMFHAHRCVLSARSEYFAHMLETKWRGKTTIALKHPLVGAVSHDTAFKTLSLLSKDLHVKPTFTFQERMCLHKPNVNFHIQKIKTTLFYRVHVQKTKTKRKNVITQKNEFSV